MNGDTDIAADGKSLKKKKSEARNVFLTPENKDRTAASVDAPEVNTKEDITIGCDGTIYGVVLCLRHFS